MSIASMNEQRIAAARALATRAVSPEQIKAVQQQLIESIQSGTLPSYGGVPILEDLTKRLQMVSANQALQQGQAAPQQSIKQQVLDAALQRPQPAQPPQQPQAGLGQLPSNLPVQMAGGGIVAFDEGGEVERYQFGGDTRMYPSVASSVDFETVYDRYNRQNRERGAQEAARVAELSKTPEGRAQLAAQDRAALGGVGRDLLRPIAAAGDVLFGGPVNALANVNDAVVNYIGIPRAARALGLAGPEYEQARSSFRIGSGTATPFSDMLRAGPAAAATTPAAEPTAPVAPRTPGGPTRFERPSLGVPSLAASPAAAVSAPSFSRIGAPKIKFTEAKLPGKPNIPNFTAGLTDFDPGAYRAEVEAEAKKLEESQQPFLTAQKERMEKREARIEKEEKQAPWMSLMKAGLSMAQTPGRFGVALAKGAQSGIDDLVTAKAAITARKEKLDDLREEQARFQMNLAQGNRKEARENATNIRSLQNQADQLGLTARTATANLTQQQYGTDVTAALAQQREANQFAQQQAQLEQGAGIANLNAGLQAQQIAEAARGRQLQYELGMERLKILQTNAAAGEKSYMARLAQVQAKVRNDFETVIRGDVAFQKLIKNMPPNQQQIERQRALQQYMAEALPLELGRMGGDTSTGLSPRTVEQLLAE